MPPPLALGLCILLIGYLIRRDCRIAPGPSSAIWIPILWLLINGSRQPSQWLGLRSGSLGEGLSEGSSFDQIFYGSLIVGGILVLANRQARISQLTRNSSWIVLFFLYEGLSCLWSDFPLISFRRWIKGTGDFVMIFVILSDPYPVRAITATIKRSGYILIPFSVLLIKYYREIGMIIDDWGRIYYTGVTLDKNMLGHLLFAYGVFYAAVMLYVFRHDPSSRAAKRNRRTDLACYGLLMAMVAWLTPLANSKTSLIALITGIILLFALQFPQVRQHLWLVLITTVLIGIIADALFSVQGAILEASGRDATFTGRTGIWATVLSEPNNFLIGTGYTAFWLGDRLQRIWAHYPRTRLLQAHNGYLEVYLNLGMVGLVLLGGVIWSGLRNARRRLRASDVTNATPDDGVFRMFAMAYILAYLAYNVTEATFQGLSFLFMIFLLLAFEIQRARPHANVRPVEEQTAAEKG